MEANVVGIYRAHKKVKVANQQWWDALTWINREVRSDPVVWGTIKNMFLNSSTDNSDEVFITLVDRLTREGARHVINPVLESGGQPILHDDVTFDDLLSIEDFASIFVMGVLEFHRRNNPEWWMESFAQA